MSPARGTDISRKGVIEIIFGSQILAKFVQPMEMIAMHPCSRLYARLASQARRMIAWGQLFYSWTGQCEKPENWVRQIKPPPFVYA